MNKNILRSVAIIALFCITAFALLQNSSEQEKSNGNIPSERGGASNTVTKEAEEFIYKNGIYSSVGNYISPGGAESIDVQMTLSNDVITHVTVVAKADLPASQFWQEAFIKGHKEFVVGKKIDEVNLTKVSGASLTPKGFNDAIAKIKVQARS